MPTNSSEIIVTVTTRGAVCAGAMSMAGVISASIMLGFNVDYRFGNNK
jgi:hypothetical protein